MISVLVFFVLKAIATSSAKNRLTRTRRALCAACARLGVV
jgi:Tfp pilus assembly protein PilE